MPKLIINDKSGRMDSSMDFFLDGKFITFKETKKEIEDVDYGEHTIKAQTLFLKSLNQKINIEKEVSFNSICVLDLLSFYRKRGKYQIRFRYYYIQYCSLFIQNF